MTPRDKISDLKSFERFLRARGFSKAEAILIASKGARIWLDSNQRDHSRAMATPVFQKAR